MPTKYKKLFLLLFFIFLSWNNYGQKLSYFQTLLKPPGNQLQYGCSILQLADRGFIIGGVYDMYSDHSKILVIRTDSFGRVLWTKTYGGNNNKNLPEYEAIANGGYPLDMVFAPDSNIVILSSTTRYGPDSASFYLIKIDMNGKALWGRAIGVNSLNIGFTLVNSPGGGFILAGCTSIYRNNSDSEHVMVIKTNDTGGVLWARTYNGIGAEGAFCVTPTRDGNYLVGGYAYNTNPYIGNDALILKIDKNGKLLWSKVFGTVSTEDIFSTMELPDRSIYAWQWGQADVANAGTTQLIKLDSNGNLLWSQNYANIGGIGLGRTGVPSAMYYDPVSKLINLSAYLPDSEQGVYWGLFHLKTDTSGNVKYFKKYSNDISVKTGTGPSMVPIAGGGCVVVSSSYSSAINLPSDIYFVKVDSGGASNSCTVSSRTYKKTTYPMQVHAYNFSVTFETPSVSTGIESNDIIMSDTSYCAPFIAAFGYKYTCPFSLQFYDSTYQYPVSWKWDFGDISSASNTSVSKNPFHIYSKPGVYTVRLIVSNGTVVDTSIQKITIYSLPTPFKFDTTICSGSTITLRASGGATYKWSPAKLVGNPNAATTTTSPKRTTSFIVQAISAQGCVTNDTAHVTVDNKPSPPKIDYTTVKLNSEIDIKFQRSDSNDVKYYEIFRSVNGGRDSLIKTINNVSNKDTFYFFKDSSVNAAVNKYSYKILAIDSCGAASDTSILHQPILLAVKQLGCAQTLQLNWSAYQGWAAVNGYDIFRTTNAGPDSLIATLANTATTYKDTGLDHKNTYCYKIIALDNTDSFNSQSNIICMQTFFPDAPKIVSVSKITTSTTNGAVIIEWSSINKASLAYNELYFSRDNKNFSPIGSHLLPGVNSFTQSGLDTKDSDYYYYLVTVDSCGAQSIKSPVSKTMTLTVSVGQLLHKLNWTPYKGFKIKMYKIERFQKGHFTTIDSVPGTDTSSKEFPAPCNYAIRYRIAAVGFDSGEVAWSDTMGRQAIDTVPSDPPIMINATVLNGSSAKINFIGSDSADTYEFAIQHSIDGNWGTAGTILYSKPGDTLQYIDNGINTIKNHICYTVITLDSCLNASASDTFCLINLQGKGVQMSDSLNWYPFEGYGLTNYAILTLNQSGNWDTLTIVNQNDTVYYNANLKCNQTITYKIAGLEKSGNKLTFSDSVTLTPFDTIKPQAPTLYYATVLPDQTVKLSWQWDTKSIVKYFEIWRILNHGPAELIDTVGADSSFIDKSANVKNNIYGYDIIAIDSCNLANRSLPSAQSILMNLKLYSMYCQPEVQIKWTPYIGFGLKNYIVYRSTDGVNFGEIGNVNASDTTFKDTLVVAGAKYDYKIEAVAQTGYTSYSDSLSIVPRIIPEADSAQIVYATVIKSDENNGAIYIKWKRAALNDTNARGYYLYSFNSTNGKYALLKDITDLNDTTFINSNINTIKDIFKYYVITYNVCDVGINSNIHRTIWLNVHGKNLSEQLDWIYYLGVPVKNYSVYRSIDGGPRNLVKNVGTDSSYLDSNIACNHNISYQVQAILANGEITFSDSITVKSYDTVRPITKTIILATITKTGTADGMITLMWNGASDNNLLGYNIYRSIDGFFWVPIVKNYPGTSLIDMGLNTYRQSYYYKIQPVDSCGNMGTFTIYNETIDLKASSGNGYNQLSWNGYVGWPVNRYLVYRDGILIDTVTGSVFKYKDTAIICHTVYQYLIKAIDADNDTIISASNTDSTKAVNHNPPQKVYIKTVTVSKPNKAATITWTPSKSYDVKDYLVYRKNFESGSLRFEDSTSKTEYIDSSQGFTQPDCYYVFARDHCGNISDGSNQGCVIIINAKNQQGYNDLTWNSYQNWPDGVQNYNVYKNEDSTGWQLIGTTSSVNVNEFDDKKLSDSTIDFCYQVEAIENPGQYNQLSRSTVECVHQDATVFIPNSFTPYNQDGVNDLFGPKGIYIKDYSMRIYNRWGELIYNGSTKPPYGGAGEQTGWDGTYKGQAVQQGVYIYLITVTDFNGKQSYFKGTVTMFE